MSKNPIINALCASAYIGIIVSIITFLSNTQKNKPDTFLAPVLFLSMLTLSACVMAYIFFYQPLQLFIDGKKKAATDLFIKTVGAFAVITIIVLITLFSGLIK